MKKLEQAFAVSFTYPVHFTRGLFEPEQSLFYELIRSSSVRAPVSLLFVLDDGVAKHHPTLSSSIANYCSRHRDLLHLSRSPIIVPGGEAAKNDPGLVESLLKAINRYAIDRHAYVVAIGGGAVLDMAGYAAAIAHRGIRHIRIPTTVLSQNDSGVGVKNGINYFGKKNFLGTFAPPVAVLNDLDFLHTLEDRDWRAGISEAVKVALIKDAAFFEFLEEQAATLVQRHDAPMEHLIFECARLHLQHIAGGDPFELGSSRPLDFGHWAAHKLEQLTDYRLRHGEAVAIGIALDTAYAYLKGMIDRQARDRVIRLLRQLHFELYVPEMEHGEPELPILLQGLEEFREHLGGQLTIMLLEGIGRGREVHEMDPQLILQSIGYLKGIHETATV